MDLTDRVRSFPTAVRVSLIVLLAVAAGYLAGSFAMRQGVTETLAIALLPAVIIVYLQSVWMGFVGIVAVIVLLPYAVLPVGASVTPTFLETAMLAAFGVGLAVLLVDRRQRLQTGGPAALVLALVGMTAFAFLLGVGRGYTPQTLHDYGKFVLAIATFWFTLQLVSSARDGGRVLLLLMAGTATSAFIALGLYAAGPTVTLKALSRLVPYGYPGSGIVRFIEDDPAKPMRAIGTSVDPNSFGGLLMVGFVLAVGQLLVRRRAVHPWIAGGVAALTGSAMLLSYSRGAWVGAFAGILLMVVLRRRWLLVPMAAVGAVVIAAGIGSGFITRLWLGFTLQDPATKLRLAEYRNAWEIIQQHPWFGVGFGHAGSVELQAGVSSIYLTIAERAGLVGLAVFLIVVATVLWRGLRAGLRYPDRPGSDLTLCFTCAFAACLSVGIVDHYFFNPQFPHMVALFWIVAGTVTALSDRVAAPVAATRATRSGVSSEQYVRPGSHPRRWRESRRRAGQGEDIRYA
jgi:O-antigen ligase